MAGEWSIGTPSAAAIALREALDPLRERTARRRGGATARRAQLRAARRARASSRPSDARRGRRRARARRVRGRRARRPGRRPPLPRLRVDVGRRRPARARPPPRPRGRAAPHRPRPRAPALLRRVLLALPRPHRQGAQVVLDGRLRHRGQEAPLRRAPPAAARGGQIDSVRMGGARWLLSGGLLGTGEARRTVRDWVVDLAIFVVAVGVGRVRAQLDVGPALARGRGARHRARDRRLRRAVVAARAARGRSRADRDPAVGGVRRWRRWRRCPRCSTPRSGCRCGRSRCWTALAVALSPVFPLLYPDVEGRGYGWQVIVGLLLTAVALGWGLFVRAQRELVRGLRERGQEEAREAERRRIAREMHDVLAHRLSILSVHAGALENAAAAAGVPRGRARDPDERAHGAGGAAAGDRPAAARGDRRRRAAAADAGASSRRWSRSRARRGSLSRSRRRRRRATSPSWSAAPRTARSRRV